MTASISYRTSVLLLTSWVLAGGLAPLAAQSVAQEDYLKANNAERGDQFGLSVAISGDTAVVGAFREDGIGIGVNGLQRNGPDPSSLVEGNDFDAGAAYVFVRNGSTWSQEAYLKPSNTGEGDEFGRSVAISGNTIVVGAWQEDSASSGVNGSQADNSLKRAGAAYVFVRSGTTWSQQAYLKASNPGWVDRFGSSVAIDGDTIVVGAIGEDSAAAGVNGEQTDNGVGNAGAAYVFVRMQGGWSQQAYLKASNPGWGDEFGSSVAISGDTVVVGAKREDSASPGVNGEQDNDGVEDSGAAYVFVREDGAWNQQAYLKASKPGDTDWFGAAVSIDGDTLVVGAPVEDSGAYVVNGNENDDSVAAAGAAYVFQRVGPTWSQQAYLKAHNPDPSDRFGWGVAVEGGSVAVGCWSEDSAATGVNGSAADNSAFNSGAAYIYRRGGSNWGLHAYIKASNTKQRTRFGVSVAMSGDRIIVGSHFEAGGEGTFSGAAYVFVISGPDIVLASPKTIYWTFELPFLDFGPLREAQTVEQEILISNTDDLALQNLVGTLGGEHAGAFRLLEDIPDNLPVGETMTVLVEFAPPAAGEHVAVFNLEGFFADGSAFALDIGLTGMALSNTADSDGDGLADGVELLLQNMGFDWQVNQAELVWAYYDDASEAGLFTAEEIQALQGPNPVLSRDPETGRVRVTMDWMHSTDLVDFLDLPLDPVDVMVTSEGDIQFEFEAEERAMFFRIDLR